MKIIPAVDMPHSGLFMLLYGQTDVGKTCSVIQTAPGPIAWFQFEKRAHDLTMLASGTDPSTVDAILYEGWDDMLKFHADASMFTKYNTILSDGISYLMNVELSKEIEDESFEALKDDEKKTKSARKSIIMSTKMSLEGFGGMSSNMFRYLRLLGRLAHEDGKIVILTALEQDNPKWDRELVAGPAFKGKEFPANMPGFFDLIGYVQPRHKEDKDGNLSIVYPPWVSFQDIDNQGFLCKYTGPQTKKDGTPFKPRGPLDVTRLLAMIKQEV